MGFPFNDITLYIPSPHANGTPEAWAESSLFNFVSDLYVRKMNGYKPPNTSRVTIQPAFHKEWDRTWRNGSIVAIAPEFIRDEYESLDKHGKYKHTLDLIQGAMIQLSDEYKWDKTIFEKAYKDILDANFAFWVDYPAKMARDKKKTAYFRIEKTETVSSGYLVINNGDATSKIKLFDKWNWWLSDGIYAFPRCTKWLDSNTFGLNYAKGLLEIWHSIERNKVSYLQKGIKVDQIDFGKVFSLDS
jgi:hypothetical protein